MKNVIIFILNLFWILNVQCWRDDVVDYDYVGSYSSFIIIIIITGLYLL